MSSPGSPLLEAAKALPSLLNELRRASQPGASQREQTTALEHGCELLGRLVGAFAGERARQDYYQGLMNGIEVSIPESEFQKFVDYEIGLMKGSAGFTDDDLIPVADHLRCVKDDLNRLRFDSVDVVR